MYPLHYVVHYKMMTFLPPPTCISPRPPASGLWPPHPPKRLLADGAVLDVLDLLGGVEPAAGVEVDGPGVDPPARLLGEVVVQPRAQPDDDAGDHGDEVGEEVLGARGLVERPDAEVELDDDEHAAPGEPPPRGDGEGPGAPRQLVDGAALHAPGVAHADVREADHGPAEEGDERGEVREPGEDGRARLGHVHEGEAAADDERRGEGVPGAADPVGLAHLLEEEVS